MPAFWDAKGKNEFKISNNIDCHFFAGYGHSHSLYARKDKPRALLEDRNHYDWRFCVLLVLYLFYIGLLS